LDRPFGFKRSGNGTFLAGSVINAAAGHQCNVAPNACQTICLVHQVGVIVKQFTFEIRELI
jgi:hypothetical protein